MAVPPDFAAAVIAALEQNGACAAAFGDTPASPRFHGVQAATAVPVPYARVLELPAGATFESADGAGLVHYYEAGELQLDVFAASESSARSLGKLAAAALNDAPLVFADGQLLELRQARAFFVPEPEAGPGLALVYHRVLLFQYRLQRTL